MEVTSAPHSGVRATSALTGVSVHTTTASNQVYTTSTTNSEVTLHGRLGGNISHDLCPRLGGGSAHNHCHRLGGGDSYFSHLFLLSYVLFFLFSF